MSLTPSSIKQYHVFLASPADVGVERQYVRRFFDDYNRHTAHIWNARFEVIDWENYSTIGVGRPQELITQQTLEKYKNSLALVVGIMGQRFGSPSGKAESGTEEEFNWALASNQTTGFPEIKWFFRKADNLTIPADPQQALAALEQWNKVLAFRKRMQDLNNPVFYTEYAGAAGFGEVFERDLNLWLTDPARPWAAERGGTGAVVSIPPPSAFDTEGYRAAVLQRFDKLNFEMLDTTGAYYSGVRLWSVFVEQSVRECHQYNPRLLEIPKEHQKRLLEAGEITSKELKEAEQEAEQLRQEYFRQSLRPVLEVVDEALGAKVTPAKQKLVILGDPGSGKTSLIRYLIVRWARLTEPALRDSLPIPLVIDLANYARWQCDGQKGFIRFLEDAPVWYEWHSGQLEQLLRQPGRAVLLLDGLDEIFELPKRDAVINDIQRFCTEYPHTPVLVTSRVVGYQAHRLRDAEFRHFMLQDLDAKQIDAFIDRWHTETFPSAEQAAPKRDRLRKGIRESKSIATLAGNPLLLTMMAILNRNQELPRDRADLYAQASRLLLHQWDTERTLADFPGLSTEVGLREKTEILRRVAWHMQASPGGLKGNLIDGETLTGLIEAYLGKDLHFDQARAAARTVVDHLRLRNFILCFVGADSYAFVHRTFLEYYCAVEFIHRFNVAKSLDINGLIALFNEHCRQDEWREVLRLICGQIDDAFVAEIIASLLRDVDVETWDGKKYLHELGLALAIMTEVRNPSALGRVATHLLDCLLVAVARAGHWWEPDISTQMDEIANAAEAIGTRWPGLKERLPLATPSFAKPSSVGMAIWPRVAVAFQEPDRKSGLREFALSNSTPEIRTGALEALAAKWPDETTRVLLAQRAVQDDDAGPRSTALGCLAQMWPEEATRALLAQRAVQDDDGDLRSTALEALAETWPDETTRALLAQRAVQDGDAGPRGTALYQLAQKWPNESTRALLAQRAVQDDHAGPRTTVLNQLAEKWPDETTRALLAQRAVQDDEPGPRSTTLGLLAQTWPEETTRALLAQRAVQDNNPGLRGIALEQLAEKWPDETTRALLAQRAVQDDEPGPRSTALGLLAQTWPEETTRALLAQRAVQDDDAIPRIIALQLLAEKWPDASTHALLAQRAVQDDDERVRGQACSTLGKMHSEFGGILPTRDLDGRGPYLDPLQPIPREHIERAAKEAGIRPKDIDAQVASLSAHLGWDITRGAKAPRKTGRKKRRGDDDNCK